VGAKKKDDRGPLSIQSFLREVFVKGHVVLALQDVAIVNLEPLIACNVHFKIFYYVL
jgi:hypothetical protein